MRWLANHASAPTGLLPEACAGAGLHVLLADSRAAAAAAAGCVYNDEGVVIDGGATLLWPHEAGEGLSSPRRIATIHYSFQQARAASVCKQAWIKK